jgi:hypothetical protein
MKRAPIILAALLLGCAGPRPRFADRGILWHDPDDLPVPVPPARPYAGGGRYWTGIDNALFRPAERVFTADYGVEAVNVNALDELPDSSWFVDRRRSPEDPSAAPRPLPLADVERGANREEPPRPPFAITRTLEGGSALGFVVDDALGRRYAMKLNPAGHDDLVSGADAVANRLAYCSGWLVPANQVVELARADVTLKRTATQRDKFDQVRPFHEDDLEALFGRAARRSDGRYRALASRWVDGRILGFFSWVGRNRHDPNDRYAHQNRRDLRGFGVWTSWVDDIDTVENNTLDSYVGAPGQGHVVHYELDVGGSFGTFAAGQAQYWMGAQSYFQGGQMMRALFLLGIVPFRWEDEHWQRKRRALLEEYPELGGFSSDNFNPRAWKPIVDVPPFVRKTARDRYWGAKRVAAFSRDEIRAAVSAGRYRPAAADYLVEALWQRRNRIARAYFSDVAPLDYFAIDGRQLCFTDWWVRSGLDGGQGTDYRAREDGQIVDVGHGSDEAGHVCVGLPRRTGYRVVELAALRPGERHFGRGVSVHIAEDLRGARVIGLIR